MTSEKKEYVVERVEYTDIDGFNPGVGGATVGQKRIVTKYRPILSTDGDRILAFEVESETMNVSVASARDAYFERAIRGLEQQVSALRNELKFKEDRKR